MTVSFRIGIRGRLFWAFGAVATVTIAATIIAWVSFTRLGDTLELIVGSNVPAVALSAQLAERGGGIIGTAPALSAAQNNGERERIWAQLSTHLQNMNTVLDAMSVGGAEGDILADFHDAVEALKKNLKMLDTVVSQRLTRTIRKDELIERLRWASADFLDEIEPMIDDSRFNITLALSRGGQAISSPNTLEKEMAKQRSLFAINSDGSLLAELIGRAANLPSNGALQDTLLYFREIEARINRNFLSVEGVPGAWSLHQSIIDIQAFANGDEGLFILHTQELSDLGTERDLLSKNQALLSPLLDLIAQRVVEESAAALQSAERSQATIRQGRFWLAAAVIISLLVSVLIVWFYVGQGLVGRIKRLDESMRSIAYGDLSAHVPVSGADEITDMAEFLRTFRDTLSETQAELVQTAKLAALGQLTAGISHEINQPLVAIRHYARNTAVLIEQNRTIEAQHNLDKIDGLLEKANRIMASLRDLARRPKRDLHPTNLVSVFEEVLTLLEHRVVEHNVEVKVRIDEACCNVLAGQVLLEQVVLNLINNAIDAMVDSPIRRLIISVHAVDDWVDLCVSDTGMGIDDEHLTKVFDPFFTTKEVGEGLGLGLSVSFNIIKDLGGLMRVESSVGDGTSFWVRLKSAHDLKDMM